MKSFVTAVLIAILLSMAVVIGLSPIGRGGATQTLISEFNTVRSAPLVESSVLDASAQAASNNSCVRGGYILPSTPPGASSFVTWMVYGYPDAASVWAAEQTDPSIMAYIKSSTYNAAGVGVATPCGNIGILWTIELAHLNSIVTPIPSATPRFTTTPTPTIRPTVTTGVTRTPTITGTPSVCTGPTAVTGAGSIICSCATGVCFIGHTTPPTPTPSYTPPTPSPTATAPTPPTPTRAGPVVGDLNCDGRLTAQDALVILIAIAENKAIPSC